MRLDPLLKRALDVVVSAEPEVGRTRAVEILRGGDLDREARSYRDNIVVYAELVTSGP